MKKFRLTVQQRIGTMICVIGLATVFINGIQYYMEGETFIQIISYISIWVLFLTILPFMVSIFIENNFLKFLQFSFFIFTGVINIMDSYDDVYGPGMFFAAWLLGRHYGFFERRSKLKYTLFIFFLIASTQVSAIIHDRGAFTAGKGILLYTIFIVLLVIILWKDMISQQKLLKLENSSLIVNYKRIQDQLKELEEEQKPYNLKAIRITPSEERVIKILTIYKASNKEIAERLNLAESTVKLHLYNIFNKIGVDNRFAIIDLCKYNYS